MLIISLFNASSNGLSTQSHTLAILDCIYYLFEVLTIVDDSNIDTEYVENNIGFYNIHKYLQNPLHQQLDPRPANNQDNNNNALNDVDMNAD